MQVAKREATQTQLPFDTIVYLLTGFYFDVRINFSVRNPK